MTTSVATGVAGAAIGFVVGGPQGAAWGWAIGSTVGNVLDPQVIRGPSLGEIQQQTIQEGVPIPIVYGLSPPMSGNVWAAAPPRVVTETSGGKGGPKVENEVIYRTYAVEFCEGPIGGFVRVWRNNVKVYDALDPVFTEPDFILGSSDPGPSRNEVFLEKARFYLGTYDQDASPDLEAIYGVGTTAVNRGIAYMVIVDEDCTREAGVIPQWKVQVSSGVEAHFRNEVLHPWLTDQVEAGVTGADPRHWLNGHTYHILQTGYTGPWSASTSPPSIPPGTFSTLEDAVTAINAAWLAGGKPLLSYGWLVGYYAPGIGPDGAGTVARLANGSVGWRGPAQPTGSVEDYVGLVLGPSDLSAAPPLTSIGGSTTGTPLPRWDRPDPLPSDSFMYFGGAGYSLNTSVGNIGWRKPTSSGLGATQSSTIYHSVIVTPSLTLGNVTSGTAIIALAGCATVKAIRLPGPPTEDSELVFGSFKVLQTFVHNLSSPPRFPLDPCLDENDQNYDSQDFWESAYAQAVSDGTMSAGKTYSATGTGNPANTYPILQGFAYRVVTSGGNSIPTHHLMADLCRRAGIPEDRVDVSRLPDAEVIGIHVTNQYPASQALLALGQIYHFDIASFDNKLHFIPRGGNSVATITEDDMVDDGDIEQEKRSDSIQIPRLLQLTYHDASTREIQSPGHGPFPPLNYTWHNDALSPQKQSSERPEDRRSTGEMTIQSAVVMDADTAARAVAVQHKVMAEDLRGELRFSLPDSLLRLAPSDPIIVQWNGKSERARIQRVDIMEGFQQYTLLRDRQSAYTSQIEGIPPPLVPPPPSQVGGPTLVVPLDIPLVADPDDSLGLGYYVAVTGFTDAWSGALVELSRDGGANYTESRTATAGAVIGELTSTLPDHPQAYPDDTSEFTVRLHAPSAALLDSDLAGMLNGQNLAAIGNPTDGWELINFSNVEETDPGFREWTVSGLLRGRKHTATREHPAETLFVLLDRNALHFQQANLTDLGRTLTLRATTVGETVSTSTTSEFVLTGQTQVEFPVGYLMAERDGNDVAVSWQGAGRIGAGVQVAHGVSFTGYRVTFDDGATQINVSTLVQEITQDVSSLSNPITVRVAQANSLTGNGPSTEVIA